LPGSGEQVIYNPILAYGMFTVNTVIPPSSAVTQALTCDNSPPSGYTMGVSMASGGAAKASFFGTLANTFPTYNGQIVGGIGVSGTGTPSLVTTQGQSFLVQQTQSGAGVVTQINPGAAGVGSRLNWTRVR